MRCTWIPVVLISLLALGCSQTRESEMAGQMPEMKKPPVPEQMARLDAWLGTWQGTAELVSPSPEEMKKMGMGEMPAAMKGESRFEKTMGGMVLKQEGWHEMGEGQRGSYLMLIKWDAAAGKYRVWYFSDWDEASEGWMTLDPSGKAWTIEASSTDAKGHKTKGRGLFKQVDDNTVTWTWTENLGGGNKMEMKGTDKRVSK